jgi:predicted helicase
MYSRFFRWAADRIEDDGIIAFVTNRGFMDQHSFDGFRAIAEREFNELWVLDPKGDARTAGEARRRQGGNVFGDQIRVGIAIYCFVRKKGATGFLIHYEAVRDYAKADEKIEFLRKPLRDRTMTVIKPNKIISGSTQTVTSFDDFLPLVAKETKATKVVAQEQAIFKLFSLVVTNRDDWVYGASDAEVKRRVKYLIAAYNREVVTANSGGKVKNILPLRTTSSGRGWSRRC